MKLILQAVKALFRKIENTAVFNGDMEIILASSTADSTKQFRITVDDSGALTATEVT